MIRVRLIACRSPDALARASLQTDDLLINSFEPWFARQGVLMKAPPEIRRLAIYLFTRIGMGVSAGDIIDALWGDDKDGGPEWARGQANEQLRRLRNLVAGGGVEIQRVGQQHYVLKEIGSE